MDYYKELNINMDNEVSYFQSSQISEYDISTALLLKGLKFEIVNKDVVVKDKQRKLLRAKSGDSQTNLVKNEESSDEDENESFQEPCKVVWRINFNSNDRIAFFLVS